MAQTPDTEALLAALRAHQSSSFAARSKWMRQKSTIASVIEALRSFGVQDDAYAPKVLLAVLYMAMDDGVLSSQEPHDVAMRHEAQRFHGALCRALGEGVCGNLPADVTRAVAAHGEWRRVDFPETVQHLTASVVAHGVRERERGVESPAPPEHVLSQLRLLDAEAAAEARRRFDVAWTRVPVSGVDAVVADVAERALWDVITERVQQGDFLVLFGVLGEMHAAMRALVAHCPARCADLDEHFDVPFVRQQAEHDALSHEDVCKLMTYLVDTISAMQAPIDDADARAWSDAAHAAIASAHETDLLTFAHQKLVPFLRDAIHRLRAVYRRTVELADALARDDRHHDAAAVPPPSTHEGRA